MADSKSERVAQAEAELENAERLGSEDRARAAQKQLAAAGVKRKAAAAKDDGDAEKAKRSAPEGRTSRPRSAT